jgi:hypothetical protein
MMWAEHSLVWHGLASAWAGFIMVCAGHFVGMELSGMVMDGLGMGWTWAELVMGWSGHLQGCSWAGLCVVC